MRFPVTFLCECGCEHEFDACDLTDCFVRDGELAYSRLVLRLRCPIWDEDAVMIWNGD